MKSHAEQGAPRASRPELIPGLTLLVVAAVLVGAALYRKSLPPYLVKLSFEVSGSVLLAAAGLLSSWSGARARARGALVLRRFSRKGARPLPRPLEMVRTYSDRARVTLANVDWMGDWLPLGLMVAGCVATLYLCYRGWKPAADPSTILDQWLFGGLIGLCFPVLVLERRYATLPRQRMADAISLSLLLRVVLVALLCLAISYLLRWLALPYQAILERVALLLTGLVAAEILARNASYIFMPLPPLESRQGRAESFIAGLLRLQKPSLKAMSASVSSQFGIDLSRSWALGFVRRAALPSLGGLILAGWLMTGVTALDLSQRAVYEAFGQPQGVFHSGLHLHLPWPFGRLKPVEYGVVREIPIVFPATSTATGSSGAEAASQPGTIEGPPPESADRLWDASHPSEASYLVASNRNGQETFEVVNIDLQILYRVGLSDRAALNAAYRVDNPEALIRVAAGRMLAHYFARYTIPDVLGQNRARFIRGFQQELQGRLNVLASGIDILGVVIEAIHPPSGAAASYQDVQAAGIRSETQVATARGDAAGTVTRSKSQATSLRDEAAASGAEMINQAKVDTALFAGDVAAYHKDGPAFLFERRLSAVGKAIRIGTPLTVVDSHIPPAQMPTLDLRPAGAPQTPPPYSEDDER